MTLTPQIAAGVSILSVRNQPAIAPQAIAWFQQEWATEDSAMVYDDAISRAIGAQNPLPQWYLLLKGDVIIGGAGLITNDFISRCELYPWLCALSISPEERGKGYASALIEHIARHTAQLGFNQLHLCTDMEGFYERSGFRYNGEGYHPWGERSRVYTREL